MIRDGGNLIRDRIACQKYFKARFALAKITPDRSPGTIASLGSSHD
jgi:hypothetical protein